MEATTIAVNQAQQQQQQTFFFVVPVLHLLLTCGICTFVGNNEKKRAARADS